MNIKGAIWRSLVWGTGTFCAASGLLKKLECKPQRRVIIYHDIPQKSIKQFEEQITHLVKAWDIVSLKTLLEDAASPSPLRTRRLAITFDDAYRSIHEQAFPILQRYRISSTIFVPVGFIESSDSNKFRRENLRVEEGEPGMTWGQLQELLHEGHAVGSHSWNHVDFGQPDVDFRQELSESKKALESKLGNSVDMFAFPFGKWRNMTSQSIQEVRQAGYRYCFSGINGPLKNEAVLRRTYLDPTWPQKLVRSALAGVFDCLALERGNRVMDGIG
jgi:peptidoglycan/xylan/chitin deacetylase (PgdA/CDA1 family)